MSNQISSGLDPRIVSAYDASITLRGTLECRARIVQAHVQLITSGAVELEKQIQSLQMEVVHLRDEVQKWKGYTGKLQLFLIAIERHILGRDSFAIRDFNHVNFAADTKKILEETSK